MSEHKGAITLVIIALIVFGVWVGMATGVLNPMITKIGAGFSTMVDNVFQGNGMPTGGGN